MELLDQLAEALERGDGATVGTLTAKAIASGLPPKDILDRGLIAAMAVVLEGQVDAIILTGSMAHAGRFTTDLSARIDFLAPVKIIPGSLELEALAQGAWRVLLGEETAQDYA